MHISLKASTPNDSPITVHHCSDVIGASLKSDCIPGTSRTIRVRAVTKTIVNQSHLLVNILWVNQLFPDLMLKIIVNWLNTIVAKVIVLATSSDVLFPIM